MRQRVSRLGRGWRLRRRWSRVLWLDLNGEGFASRLAMLLMVIGIGSNIVDGRTVVTRARVAELVSHTVKLNGREW